VTGDATAEAANRRRDELIEAARAAGRGDLDGVTRLVRATSPTIWRACAALVDRASADDLTQDTFARAMRSLASYRGDSDPTRWLLTIARRVCAEEIGRRQRDRLLMTRIAAQPLSVTGELSQRAELADALTRLSIERREALVLTAVIGLSYAEAAEVCRCPVGTIRSRVARARTDLIAAFERPSRERAGDAAG
jgi:RNA polymerase sigma-70 factor (ECF subfamily)